MAEDPRTEREQIAQENWKLIEAFQQSEEEFARRSTTACILFADMVGSTGYKYGRSAVAGLEKSLRHNFEIEKIIESEKWRGEVVSFIGDGVMAYFTGADGDANDGARRAVGAALEIIRKFRQYNQQIPEHEWPRKIITKIGIHTGSVWMMHFKQRTRVDPQGTAVDFAARLCEIAPHMHALMSEATFQAAAEALSRPGEVIYKCGPEKRRLRGVKDMQQLYAVTPDEPSVTEIPLPGSVQAPTKQIRGLLDQARGAVQNDQIDEAMHTYESILSQDKRNFEANYYLAELLVSYQDHDPADRLDKAYEYLCEAKSERPQSCYLWKLLSWVQFQRFLFQCRNQQACDKERCIEFLHDAVRYATHALRIAEGYGDSNGAAIAKVYLTIYLTERFRNKMPDANGDRQQAEEYIEACIHTFAGREKIGNTSKSNFYLARAMSIHAKQMSASGVISRKILNGILKLLKKAEILNPRNRLAVEFHNAVLGGGDWGRF